MRYVLIAMICMCVLGFGAAVSREARQHYHLQCDTGPDIVVSDLTYYMENGLHHPENSISNQPITGLYVDCTFIP